MFSTSVGRVFEGGGAKRRGMFFGSVGAIFGRGRAKRQGLPVFAGMFPDTEAKNQGLTQAIPPTADETCLSLSVFRGFADRGRTHRKLPDFSSEGKAHNTNTSQVWGLCCVFAMLVLFLAGCEASPKAGEDVLAQAEYHCLEQEWDQAIPLLRQYLADHPRHAGAHFYLGRSYLNSSDPWLVLAEGELETALRLFIQQGKVSPIKRFSDSYFEQICHIERSKVFLKQVLYVADHPGKLHGAVPVPDILAKCRQALDAAKRIAPDSPDVKNLESILRRMTAPARPKRRPRSHLPAT